MPGRLLSRAIALGALLMLSGCMFADGVAHVVKLSESAKGAPAAKPAATQPVASEPAADQGGAAPPTPQAPPPRDDVIVEALPSGR